MTSFQCCNCGCQDSSRWICGPCNSISQSITPFKTYPIPQQTNPTTLSIHHLSSIKKDQPLLSTSQKHSTSNLSQSLPHLPLSSTTILCQQHNQPITFFHQQKHQLFCALCLFDSSISKQIVKPYGLTPIKASTDLVLKEFKTMMEEINEGSKGLDQYLRRAVQGQRVIGKQRKYLESVVGNVVEEMVRVVREREEDMVEEINQRLEEQLKIYELHENHLNELKGNIRSLKLLGGRSMTPLTIKTEQLVYLFEAAKSIKKSLGRDTFKVDEFDVQEFGVRGWIEETEREEFEKLIVRVIGWIEKRGKKKEGVKGRQRGKSVARNEKDRYTGREGYLEKSKKGIR